MADQSLDSPKGYEPWSKKLIIVYLLFFVLFIGSAYSFFKFLAEKQITEVGTEDNGERVKDDLFRGFSELFISPTYAKDNFSLTALDADSSGVDAASSYLLKSKERLSLDAVKENIEINPEVEYGIKKLNDTEWEITPKTVFESNEIVKITINTSSLNEAGEQDSYEYSWAFQVKDSFRVLHSIPGHAGVSVPVNSGIEITFSHEGFYDYEKNFRIEPDVAGSFEVHSRTLVFVPENDLDTAKIYTVTIDKDLPLKDSEQKLEEDYIFSFETRKTAPTSSWINVSNRNIEVDPGSNPLIKIYSRNAPKSLKVDLYKFFTFEDYLEAVEERDEIPWWSYSKEDYLIGKDKLFELMSFDAEIKDGANSKYIEIPKNLESGFYLAELSSGEQKVQVLIQSGNLAVYSNFTNTDSIVWVNNLLSGKPEPDAEVSLLNANLKTLTNSQGLAVFTTPEELKQKANDYKAEERHYLKVKKQDDIILLPASKLYRGHWWNTPSLADNYWNYLYTDRPRYQTSDVIKYWGVLRDREEKKIDKKLTVSLYKQGYVDYYYRPVKIVEKEINLSELGSFSGELELDNIKPDYYTMELSLDGELIRRKYISVRPYVKPAYSLSLESSKSKIYAGEEIELRARASFFEGTPVPNLDVIITTPNGEVNLVTDEDGEATTKFSKDYYDCAREYGCWPDSEYFYVEPKNSELAEIKESTRVSYYGPDVYADTEISYPEKGRAELKIVSRKHNLDKAEPDNWWMKDDDAEAAPSTKVKIDISEITYNKVETGTKYDYINKKSYKTYRYHKNIKKLDSIEVQTDANGEYVFKQAVKRETYYEIRLTIFDSRGRTENSRTGFYYYNGLTTVQYSNWNYNYYHLKVLNDDNNFHLGERVDTVFMNSEEALPDARSSYLFMQLRNGLREYEIAGKSAYSFPFERDDIPNINLSGVHFNGKTYLKTSTGYYGKSIEYDINESRLKIMVEPDKEEYEPGEEVNLDIYVTDKDDRPVVAEVNLNLIDEAYYAIISDSASPLETIYSNVGPGVLLTNSTHESLTDAAAMAEGGGCFLPGTKILMADKSYKNIEDIAEGDRIFTFSDPFDRQMVEGEVRELWHGLSDEYLIINDDFKLTPDHQVYSNYRFIDAGLLKTGDWLLNAKGEQEYIKSIEIVFERVMVYNLRIDPQHTFFADDFYVHNQEKGGGAREFFTDAALFDVVKTAANGRANISFTLPDNITSWRITSQGISEDLDAGVSVSKIPVSLPVFNEVSIGSKYLSRDNPIARLRAFGSELEGGDDVKFSIDSESFAVDSPFELRAKAFMPAYFSLPEMEKGKHGIVYGLETEKGADAVKLPLEVIGSRLEIQKAIDQELSVDTKITAPTNKPFAVAILDKGQNMLFNPLLGLSWTWGDRIDQKIAKNEAVRLLNKYYDTGYEAPDFEAENYQLVSGGLSLLPYGSEDIELSLKVANLNTEFFDKEALRQYFFSVFDNRKSARGEITYSLCGLAALGEPVIPKLKIWLQREDLSLQEEIYLGIALAKLGLKQNSQEIYYSILNKYGEKKEPHIAIRNANDNDIVFKNTSLMAYLGAILQDENAMAMFDFVKDNQNLHGRSKNSDQLFVLEEVSYIESELPNLNPQKARVIFEYSGKETEVEISGGKVYAFEATPGNIDTLIFKEVDGELALSIRYMAELEDEAVGDNDIGIERAYFVDGKQSSSFQEDDLIEVRIYPKFADSAYNGNYQITDILPSGLAPVTKLHTRGASYGCKYWYPYNTDGQRVKFRINKYWKNYYCGGDYFHYYARVANKGSYWAEPVLLQSFDNPAYLNFSNGEKIIIK